MTDPPPRPTAGLAAYAARLLAGTGLPAAAAARAAAGDPEVAVPAGAETAVQALRDGWSAVMTAEAELEPEPGMGGPG